MILMVGRPAVIDINRYQNLFHTLHQYYVQTWKHLGHMFMNNLRLIASVDIVLRLPDHLPCKVP